MLLFNLNKLRWNKIMYAVFETNGKQYKVKNNDIIRLERINMPINNIFEFCNVLMVAYDKKIFIGEPILKNCSIKAEVINHIRGEKIKIIKFRRRKHYRKQQGYCQFFTNIKIININFKEIK